MENHNLNDNEDDLLGSENEIEEYTPKLFSEEQNFQSDNGLDNNDKERESLGSII